MLVEDARIVWNSLKGLICVYKPSEVTCNKIRKTITVNICKELCEMKYRPVSEYVNIVGNDKNLVVQIDKNYADNPLVVGPRYQPKDIRCTWATFLGKHTSGVLVLGLNEGAKLAQKVHMNKPLRAYHISGKFGSAMDTFYSDGKIVEKSTFRHITQKYIQRLLASMQAAHQRKIFEACGVDMESQAGYDLAAQGLIRPADSKIPIIYGIKCISLNLPEFIIEVHAINEYEKYLMALIHEIGLQLKSTAYCTSIKCIRHSYFTLDDVLLSKHWNLQHIINNMKYCQRILDHYKNITAEQNSTLQSWSL